MSAFCVTIKEGFPKRRKIVTLISWEQLKLCVWCEMFLLHHRVSASAVMCWCSLLADTSCQQVTLKMSLIFVLKQGFVVIIVSYFDNLVWLKVTYDMIFPSYEFIISVCTVTIGKGSWYIIWLHTVTRKDSGVSTGKTFVAGLV